MSNTAASSPAAQTGNASQSEANGQQAGQQNCGSRPAFAAQNGVQAGPQAVEQQPPAQQAVSGQANVNNVNAQPQPQGAANVQQQRDEVKRDEVRDEQANAQPQPQAAANAQQPRPVQQQANAQPQPPAVANAHQGAANVLLSIIQAAANAQQGQPLVIRQNPQGAMVPATQVPALQAQVNNYVANVPIHLPEIPNLPPTSGGSSARDFFDLGTYVAGIQQSAVEQQARIQTLHNDNVHLQEKNERKKQRLGQGDRLVRHLRRDIGQLRAQIGRNQSAFQHDLDAKEAALTRVTAERNQLREKLDVWESRTAADLGGIAFKRLSQVCRPAPLTLQFNLDLDEMLLSGENDNDWKVESGSSCVAGKVEWEKEISGVKVKLVLSKNHLHNDAEDEEDHHEPMISAWLTCILLQPGEESSGLKGYQADYRVEYRVDYDWKLLIDGQNKMWDPKRPRQGGSFTAGDLPAAAFREQFSAPDDPKKVPFRVILNNVQLVYNY